MSPNSAKKNFQEIRRTYQLREKMLSQPNLRPRICVTACGPEAVPEFPPYYNNQAMKGVGVAIVSIAVRYTYSVLDRQILKAPRNQRPKAAKSK